jgi:hypothetical protein
MSNGTSPQRQSAGGLAPGPARIAAGIPLPLGAVAISDN